MLKKEKEETIKLFEWAFRNYINVNLFKENESIVQADVWLGNKAIIDLVTKKNIIFTLHKKYIDNYSAKVIYNNPIPAPIDSNSQYGTLIITNTLNGEVEYPLYAKESIKKAGVFKKISSALGYFIFGGYAN